MIEPASLSTRIKATTCLDCLLSLILETSTDRILKNAAFCVLPRNQRLIRRSQPKLTAQFQPLGRPG